METITDEIWKDVPGFEGHYQVSNLGRLATLKNNQFRVMSPGLNIHGYYNATLSTPQIKRKTHRLHRIVAEVFIPKVEGKPQVNHIDGVKTNNRVDNLEWVSPSENNLHYYRVLGGVSGNKGKLGSESKCAKKVYVYGLNKELIGTYGSAIEAAQSLNLSYEHLRKVTRKGKRTTKYYLSYQPLFSEA